MKVRRRKLEAGIPYLPMADIAFNLVLFFIMMARVQDDSKLGVVFARAPHTETAVAESRVRVAVNHNGAVYLNGNQISVTQLAGAIESILGREPPGHRTVLLKIHKDTMASTFEPIIEAVSEAGGDIFHVLEEEDSKKP
jgi:biopolymer transport protein ExbD